MGVSRAHNGLPLDRLPFELYGREEMLEVAVGARIGITKAADLPWRYGVAGSKFLSKPFKAS
jgi:DNA-3-methyladenine glycosylase